MKNAAGVLIINGNQILGFSRADNSGWSIPFGKVDPGESPREAAIRECFEETGFIVNLLDDEPFVDIVGSFTGHTFKAVIVGGTKLDYKEHEGFCDFIDPANLCAGGYSEYNTNMLKHFQLLLDTQ